MTTISRRSAIVRRSLLEQQRIYIERWSAITLLGVGVIGTVIALHGGLASITSQGLRPGPVLAGLGLQALLTVLEWYYHDRPALAWGARVVDAGLTAAGYGALLVPLLAGPLGALAPYHEAVSWAILGAVSLFAAWYPEHSLIEEER